MLKLQLSGVGEAVLYPVAQLRPHVHIVPIDPPTGLKLQVMVVAMLVEQLKVTCVPTNATVLLGPVTMLFCPQTPIDNTTDKNQLLFNKRLQILVRNIHEYTLTRLKYPNKRSTTTVPLLVGYPRAQFSAQFCSQNTHVISRIFCNTSCHLIFSQFADKTQLYISLSPKNNNINNYYYLLCVTLTGQIGNKLNPII